MLGTSVHHTLAHVPSHCAAQQHNKLKHSYLLFKSFQWVFLINAVENSRLAYE